MKSMNSGLHIQYLICSRVIGLIKFAFYLRLHFELIVSLLGQLCYLCTVILRYLCKPGIISRETVSILIHLCGRSLADVWTLRCVWPASSPLYCRALSYGHRNWCLKYHVTHRFRAPGKSCPDSTDCTQKWAQSQKPLPATILLVHEPGHNI